MSRFRVEVRVLDRDGDKALETATLADTAIKAYEACCKFPNPLAVAEGIEDLVQIARRIDKWETRYPINRIYSMDTTIKIAEEMSDIVADARKLLTRLGIGGMRLKGSL